MATGWASLPGKLIEPRTWDECFEWLLPRGGADILYRGHACFEWHLSSTLERALLDNSGRFDERKHGLMHSMAADRATDDWARDIENVLMQRFRQQALRFEIPELPPLWDRLGWWEVMQHHGAPTRLMDWTTSPFIGLWFALEHHQKGDMALWAYSRKFSSSGYEDILKQIKSTEGYELLDERQLQNMLVEFILAGKWTALLIPTKPRPFQRAVAQQSVLTVSPRIGVARDGDWGIRESLATRIRIKENWKPEIQAAFQSLGLSHVDLFRDLDSLGISIRQNFVDNEFKFDLGLF